MITYNKMYNIISLLLVLQLCPGCYWAMEVGMGLTGPCTIEEELCNYNATDPAQRGTMKGIESAFFIFTYPLAPVGFVLGSTIGLFARITGRDCDSCSIVVGVWKKEKGTSRILLHRNGNGEIITSTSLIKFTYSYQKELQEIQLKNVKVEKSIKVGERYQKQIIILPDQNYECYYKGGRLLFDSNYYMRKY